MANRSPTSSPHIIQVSPIVVQNGCFLMWPIGCCRIGPTVVAHREPGSARPRGGSPLDTTVEQSRADNVHFDDGQFVATRSLVCSVWVRPDS